MTEHPGSDILVESLCRQGLLTEDQAKRVRQAVDSGKDLVWALSHLPLVEPLQFLRAQSQAGLGGQTPLPTRQSAPYELKPMPSGPDTPTPIPAYSVSREADSDGLILEEEEKDVPTLEIEDRDYATGFEGVGRPVDPSAMVEDADPPSLHTPVPRRSPNRTPVERVVPSPDAFARAGITPATYDLSDDEGIPLVNRVNALLAEAVGNGVRSLVFRPAAGGMEISSISDYGTEGISQSLGGDEGVKICHRLKIMARIEPWRKPPQKGIFHLQHARRQVRVLMDVTEPPAAAGLEEITLYLLPSF